MLGWPMPACIVACFAVGMGMEFVMNKNVFSKVVQTRPLIRIFILVLVFFIFLISQYVALTYMDQSMEMYVGFQLAYVIGLPIIGFFFGLCVRGYQIEKIKERYGDGSDGYVFDLKDEDIEAGKPVLVLFHHGDFTYGGSADPLAYGDRFVKAKPDTIFVSFNYRLGLFGFIDFSEVPGGEDFPDALNLGLLDQIEALRWIRDNISAFGGDPERITVMGFEDGATSISLLAVSEQAKGLFQKAFLFVGSPISSYDTPEASRALARDLLNETHTASMAELSRLDTKTLKDAAVKLWRNMCAPTCDGKLITSDPYGACQEGAASGIDFIIGIPCSERMVYRSFIGDRNYEDLVSTMMNDIEKYVDAAAFDAIQNYIQSHAADSSEFEVKAKLIEQWLAVYAYRFTAALYEAGNHVHMMYWDRTPLIDKLGSGTVDAEAELLGNGEALRMYGNVMDKDMSVTLQTFLYKFIKGDALSLYRNEIHGVDEFDWEAFPKALIVSDDALRCDTIKDRITEVQELRDACDA